MFYKINYEYQGKKGTAVVVPVAGYESKFYEYCKRSAKLEKELKQLRFWHKQLYEMHLAAVEKGIEEGTHTEMVYLGMISDE